MIRVNLRIDSIKRMLDNNTLGLMMIIGYIKNINDNVDYQLKHSSITKFAADNALDISCVYADASFENVKSIISCDCHGLVINDISQLGTTLPTIRDNLYFLKERGICLYSIDEGYQFSSDALNDEMLKGIDLAINIRSQMTSNATKKALAEKKESGIKLGRAGRPNKKYALSGKEHQVFKMIENGMPKIQIAKHFGVTVATLYNFLKRYQTISKESGK